MDAMDKEQIAKAFEFFLATGNLNSKTNLGLRQVSDATTGPRVGLVFWTFRSVVSPSLLNV